MLHSSDSRFSSGVPVSASRCSEGMDLHACAVAESAFLMFCASSRMTYRKPTLDSSSRSRRTSA